MYKSIEFNKLKDDLKNESYNISNNMSYIAEAVTNKSFDGSKYDKEIEAVRKEIKHLDESLANIRSNIELQRKAYIQSGYPKTKTFTSLMLTKDTLEHKLILAKNKLKDLNDKRRISKGSTKNETAAMIMLKAANILREATSVGAEAFPSSIIGCNVIVKGQIDSRYVSDIHKDINAVENMGLAKFRGLLMDQAYDSIAEKAIEVMGSKPNIGYLLKEMNILFIIDNDRLSGRFEFDYKTIGDNQWGFDIINGYVEDVYSIED